MLQRVAALVHQRHTCSAVAPETCCSVLHQRLTCCIYLWSFAAFKLISVSASGHSRPSIQTYTEPSGSATRYRYVSYISICRCISVYSVAALRENRQCRYEGTAPGLPDLYAELERWSRCASPHSDRRALVVGGGRRRRRRRKGGGGGMHIPACSCVAAWTSCASTLKDLFVFK